MVLHLGLYYHWKSNQQPGFVWVEHGQGWPVIGCHEQAWAQPGFVLDRVPWAARCLAESGAGPRLVQAEAMSLGWWARTGPKAVGSVLA